MNEVSTKAFTRYGEAIEVNGCGYSIIFEALRFLQKAVCKDESRPHLQCIFIEQSEETEDLTGFASDGRRLHVVKGLQPCEIGCGSWKVLFSGLEKIVLAKTIVDVKAFNYKRIMRNSFSPFRLSMNKKNNYVELVRMFRWFKEPTCLNTKYLDDLGPGSWEVGWESPQKGVEFRSRMKYAQIMPIDMRD